MQNGLVDQLEDRRLCKAEAWGSNPHKSIFSESSEKKQKPIMIEKMPAFAEIKNSIEIQNQLKTKIQSNNQNQERHLMTRGAIPQTEFIMHSAIFCGGRTDEIECQLVFSVMSCKG